jgi:hypothetical protein
MDAIASTRGEGKRCEVTLGEAGGGVKDEQARCGKMGE